MKKIAENIALMVVIVIVMLWPIPVMQKILNQVEWLLEIEILTGAIVCATWVMILKHIIVPKARTYIKSKYQIPGG